MKFGEKFYEHFIIEEETNEYYRVRCKESDEEYKLYKCKIQNNSCKNSRICKNHVCRGCGKKITLYNIDDYYTKAYHKLIEEYFNSDDKNERKHLLKRIYYYRNKSNISKEDFRKAYYLSLVKELDEDIWEAFLKKKNMDYNVDYQEYKYLYNKTRYLFNAIKKAVPEFTECETFAEYRENLLGGEDL